MWLKGVPFLQKDPMKVEKLSIIFSNIDDPIKVFKEVKGFFSIIFKRKDVLFAAVDRIRSIPLFYTWNGKELVLSDNAQWLEDYIGKSTDPVSASEFLLAGYVTGPYTLNPNIRQLQAGEAIILKNKELRLERYYHFIPKSDFPSSETLLLRELDNANLTCIERLITFANGRPIAIPLSGGMDSRLIAISLRQLGYKDVLAFSYGRKKNKESEISKLIAEQLSIPWYFVEYKEELWRYWYNSLECKRYICFAENLVSVAHIQDWPAVMELKKRKILSPETVIVPGHSGDFVAGSHIPKNLLREKFLDLGKVVKSIWEHHYVLTTIGFVSKFLSVDTDFPGESAHERIQENIRVREIYSPDDAVGLYYLWDWQERQAKFIVNSVRVYDFFGYDWWIPQWDLEFIDFWAKVPLSYRLNRCLYRRYLEEIQNRYKITTPYYIANAEKTTINSMIRELLTKIGLLSLARLIVRPFVKGCLYPVRRDKLYTTHPLAWYGIVDFSEYKTLLKEGGNINTILAVKHLKMRMAN